MSEQQKTELLKKLDVVVEQKQTQTEECKPIVKVIKEIEQMPAIQLEQYKEQIKATNLEIHKELQEAKEQLVVVEQQLSAQKQECATLQQQLLKVRIKQYRSAEIRINHTILSTISDAMSRQSRPCYIILF